MDTKVVNENDLPAMSGSGGASTGASPSPIPLSVSVSVSLSQQSSGRVSGLPLEQQQAIQFWRDFQFDTQRIQWDKVCTEMREMKTQSITGRKRLNELTKTFRALKTKEEQNQSIFELLKAYQEEIDQLSRRSKFSESSYLQVYKSMNEAPNPLEVIEHLLSHAVSVSESSQALEIQRLTQELSQYDAEFQQLKNQVQSFQLY